MRRVAVISFAQARNVRRDRDANDIETLVPVVREAVAKSGLERADVGFTTAGSNDFLAGQAFSFVRALDAAGAYPAIEDSHLEMDAAWALYEAWVRLQLGDVDSALVYGLGKTSSGNLAEIMPLSLDPYALAPLRPDPHSIATLQARLLLEAGRYTEAEFDAVIDAARVAASGNPNVEPPDDEDDVYDSGVYRRRHLPPPTDGAAAVVLAAEELARERVEHPVWIRGIDHRCGTHHLGARDLTDCPSARIAAEHAGAFDSAIDLAELHARYPHELLLLRDVLRLAGAELNPSGGPLTADPVMATGLIRIGEAASRLATGQRSTALAHAAMGPCLQNNLVCVLERDPR